ncbi:MAG: hypothetical protein LJE91_09075 [Gammaproteobacteria bacterium]|jgi:hypothetical protein|nr:hypothetical protein [Gammaproteobacteria bacterium]
MKFTKKEIHEQLHQIYEKHRKRYKGNFDSKQMCMMWSTRRPPDIIEGTKPFIEIAKAFDIEISDEECMEIYDMTIEEATIKIAGIIERQS